MYLAQITFSARGNEALLLDNLALHYVKSPLFKPWQMVTHMFMHSSQNFAHIFFNLFALWMFGSVLENLWGPKRFLIFFLLCGIGAALVHMGSLWFEYRDILQDFLYLKLHPTADNLVDYALRYRIVSDDNGVYIFQTLSRGEGGTALINDGLKYASEFTYQKISTPTIGASGAVFGVLAGFVYLFPNTYIYLYFFIPMKAKWLILLYGGMELYLAVKNTAGDDVAHWAHLGGALVGFLLVLTWNKSNRKTFY
jgi:membrane associated rhomboid family serine protease